MDVEQLRKQAKELVKAARAGDPGALERLGGRPVRLASAQLVIAREQDHASWPALVAVAEADPDAVVTAATGGRADRVRRALASHPELGRDPWVALVLGRPWHGDPSRPGGPRRWPPLVYAAHSPLADAAALGTLLARGADPNAPGPGPYGPVTALYGASGVVFDPEKTRLLLEAGANPNDNDSLYHAVYGADTTCLRLLLEHGARPEGTNALAAALDSEPLEPVRLLLEAGADPNERPDLAHAVRRGRGPETVELLLAHGADPELPGGETWRGAVPLRTPYQHAVLRARDDVAAVLARAGADTTVAPEDEAVAALARGERPAGPLPDVLDVDQQEVAITAAVAGHVDAVVDALGPGFRGVVGGSPAGTLLHHASWVGSAAVVQALLARGADPEAPGEGTSGTPLGWAAHGSGNVAGDHVAVVQALVAAGATLDPGLSDLAAGPLEAWLDER